MSTETGRAVSSADVYTTFNPTEAAAAAAAEAAAAPAVAQLNAAAAIQPAATAASNKIVTENQNAGTPQSVWAIHGSIANQGDSQIEGFATQISTNAGQTVSFKIDTASSGYTLDIYRLGYYGGNGARLITTMHHSGADNQPN